LGPKIYSKTKGPPLPPHPKAALWSFQKEFKSPVEKHLFVQRKPNKIKVEHREEMKKEMAVQKEKGYIGFNVSLEMEQALKDLSAARGVPVAKIVRDLIEKELKYSAAIEDLIEKEKERDAGRDRSPHEA
jgi:predicted DNA-binding protein